MSDGKIIKTTYTIDEDELYERKELILKIKALINLLSVFRNEIKTKSINESIYINNIVSFVNTTLEENDITQLNNIIDDLRKKIEIIEHDRNIQSDNNNQQLNDFIENML